MPHAFHVVLDTGIYRQDMGRVKHAFAALSQLCRSNVVQLHIPCVVEKEFLSQVSSMYDGKLTGALRSLEKTPHVLLKEEDLQKLDSLKLGIEELQQKVADRNREHFRGWGEFHGARFHEIDDTHGERVMENYFLGAPPFSSEKNRNDIPDAFIFESIRDLAETYGSVHAVVKDDGLRQALKQVEGVMAYESINQFINDNSLWDRFARQKEVDFYRALIDKLSSGELDALREKLYTVVADSTDAIQGLEVESPYIPRTGGAEVDGIEGLDDIRFNYGDALLRGDSIFIPFAAAMQVPLVYYILPDGSSSSVTTVPFRERHLTGNDDGPFVEVSEMFSGTLYGGIIVELPPDEELDVDLPPDVVGGLRIKPDESFELEIDYPA